MNDKIVSVHVVYHETVMGNSKEEHFENVVRASYEEHGVVIGHNPSSGDVRYTALVTTLIPYLRIKRIATIVLSPIGDKAKGEIKE